LKLSHIQVFKNIFLVLISNIKNEKSFFHPFYANSPSNYFQKKFTKGKSLVGRRGGSSLKKSIFSPLSYTPNI